MYKIGEFALKVKVPVKTLRYYDEIDLFKPDEVDIFTGYRYYSKSKITEYEIISELKTAGFSLNEIKENWDIFIDEIFIKKKKELYQEQKNVEEKIRKIDELRIRTLNGKIIPNKGDGENDK